MAKFTDYRVQHVFGFRATVLKLVEHVLRALREVAHAFFHAAVNERGKELVKEVAHLVQLVCAGINTGLKQREVLLRAGACFGPTARILGQVVAQFVGVVQPVLHTLGHEVCCVLSAQAELFHKHLDTTHAFACVRVKRLRPNLSSLGDSTQVLFTNTTNNGAYVGSHVGHISETIAPALTVQHTGDLAGVLRGHAALA